MRAVAWGHGSSRGAVLRGERGGADDADGRRSEARGPRGHDGPDAAGADAVHQGPRVLGPREVDAVRSSGCATAGRPRSILDLAVNSNSERGLLGITLDQDFKRNGTLFLYWSESTTGADSAAGDAVPLMGNRLDRYHWDGAALTYEKTIHRGRAFQDDVTNRTNPRGSGLPRQPQRRRPARRARTGRSTCRSATPAAAARRRTCSTARSVERRHPATTSSAARTPPTTTSPA